MDMFPMYYVFNFLLSGNKIKDIHLANIIIFLNLEIKKNDLVQFMTNFNTVYPRDFEPLKDILKCRLDNFRSWAL